MQFLRQNGIYHWRHNVGGIKRKGRLIKYGVTGQSDIMGILNGGKFLAIETKVYPGEPTPAQADFLTFVNTIGGIGIVAYSVDDVKKRLQKEGFV